MLSLSQQIACATCHGCGAWL
ncbi:hypothetical protein ACRE1U_06620 [Helicobacter himalayensis]